MNDQSSEEHELDNSDLVGSEPVQNMLIGSDSDNDLDEFVWDH